MTAELRQVCGSLIYCHAVPQGDGVAPLVARLYVAGMPELPVWPEGCGVGMIVLAARGTEGGQFWGRCHVVSVPLDDYYDPTPPQEADIRRRAGEAAQLVYEAMRVGTSVITSCAVGMNRSALVAGLVLRKFGMPPEAAVLRLRNSRFGLNGERVWRALENPAFERIVLS